MLLMVFIDDIKVLLLQVNVWNGSLEIGVTTLDPDYMELPATATKLRNTAWVRRKHLQI